MKFDTPKRPQLDTSVTEDTLLPQEKLLNQDDVESTSQGKVRKALYRTAIVGMNITLATTISGVINGIIQDRPYPLRPDNIQAALESTYYGTGQLLGLVECTPPPNAEDISAIIANTHTIVTKTDAMDPSSIPSERTREEVADELGLSLIPAEKVNDAIQKFQEVHKQIEHISNDELLRQFNDIVSEYLMKNFNLSFEFIPPSHPNAHSEDDLRTLYIHYTELLDDFVRNMSALPKEAYDNRVLWQIIVDANGLIGTDGTTSTAQYHSGHGTILFDPLAIGDSGALIHELWHSYEYAACADTDYLNTIMESINPPYYQYLEDKWLDDSTTSYQSESAFSSQYSQYNAQEDFAESGKNWVFNLNVDTVNPQNLTIVEKKTMIAADWANNIAPGLAEYIATISRRSF